jgi:DNA polymerase III gamma/tau subunit
MLYQEVRPKGFDQFVGNEETVRSLQALLAGKKELPHAFLFSGPTGCGKTTLARILAQELGCVEGSLIELNAANTRGIDTIRSVVNEATLRTFMAKVKVILLDESHQLTASAQECLLKILEDCPKHCFFILCTTSPNNLIPTIRNRCVQYTVGLLGRKKLNQVLSNACRDMELKVDPEVLAVIADVADGCARQALNLLEKVKDIDNVDDAFVLLTKNTLYDDSIWTLCGLICSSPEVRRKKWKEILEVTDRLEEDVEGIRRTILTTLSKKIIQTEDDQIAIDYAGLLEIFSQNTYNGGKGQLIAMVAKACLSF